MNANSDSEAFNDQKKKKKRKHKHHKHKRDKLLEKEDVKQDRSVIFVSPYTYDFKILETTIHRV